MRADRVTNGCEERAPFVADQAPGQDACVIGPGGEIIVECGAGGGINLAAEIAAMLNDRNLNHGCSAKGRRIRAKHLLLLVRENRVGDETTIDTLADVIEEAGVQFSLAEIAELTGDNVPF